MPVEPSLGWGVTHLFYRLGHNPDPALAGKALVAAVDDLTAEDPYQAICFSVLGTRADFGVMALGPDLDRLDRFRRALEAAAALEPVAGYVSLTELSEYTSTEDDQRAALAAQGLTGDELEARLGAIRERLAKYREDRLHPRLPHKRTIAF